MKGDEPSTAERLQADSAYNGGQLLGYKGTNNPDFVDSLGRTYDAVGGPTAWSSPKLNMTKMLSSIRTHLYFKTGMNFTVLDLTGASSSQIDDVFTNLDAWDADPSLTARSRLIILGDSY